MSSYNGYEENECRLCGKVSNLTETQHIFEKIDNGTQLVQLMKEFLPILVYRTDPLSKRICEDCCSNVKNFFEFKKKCLDYFNKQKDRLANKHEITENEKLFLNTLNNSICSSKKNGFSDSLNDESNDQQSESELCAELQNAIRESLTQTQLEERLQLSSNCTSGKFDKIVNGNLDDDSSQDSVFNHQSELSNSDMELCESPTYNYIVVQKRSHEVQDEINIPPKRKKLIGPKSCIERLRKIYGYSPMQNEINKEDHIIYNPLSFLQCILNCINKNNLPDHQYENFTKSKLFSLEESEILDDSDFEKEEFKCKRCGDVFKNVNMLVEHEAQHAFVVVDNKVDSSQFKVPNDQDSVLKNSVEKAEDEVDVEISDEENIREELMKNQDVPDHKQNEEDDQDLSVPVDEKSLEKGDIILVDTIAMVNGTPLADIPKDLRRTMFKSVTVNGVKRKFCPLCRYTFKDNWAIESHYFSGGCHYSCRFCGLRFNKQRGEFDEHNKEHISNGDELTDKIFASRKAHLPPKIINSNKMKAKVQLPKVTKGSPSKLRAILNDKNPRETAKDKKESHSKNAVSEDNYKPKNQAYFCRKCYQVFFKLDEFNVHVVNCTGTGVNPEPTPRQGRNSSVAHQTRKSSEVINKQTEEIFSPSGRPLRHCVKDSGPYVDGAAYEEAVRPKATIAINNSQPTERGYECSLCSSCFPTKYSRNSHMRIHKNDYGFKKVNEQSRTISRNRHENVPKKIIKAIKRNNIPTFAKYVNNVNNMRIKQEATEPIIEIHEGDANNVNIPSSIGSVSITPIPNANQKTNVDPNIMRLVQSNPNITIKTMSKGNNRNDSSNFGRNDHDEQDTSPENDNRCYRCSSCSKPFANKSNLYFHKKHQCTGSKYPCPFCRKRFGTESAYSSHIFYNHPE